MLSVEAKGESVRARRRVVRKGVSDLLREQIFKVEAV
jgi:hypothetical protein